MESSIESWGLYQITIWYRQLLYYLCLLACKLEMSVWFLVMVMRILTIIIGFPA